MRINEVDLISEGIAIIILSVVGRLYNTLIEASIRAEEIPKKFTKGILIYISGLIVLEKDATCKKIAKTMGVISHDKLTRTLAGNNVVARRIQLSLIQFCLSKTTGGWLIVDDFLIPKGYSSKIEGVYNEYDHTEDRRIKGMRVVMILWTDGEKRIPVAWSIWHKEDKEFLGYTRKGHAKYKHTGKCLLKVNGQEIPYRTKNQIALSLLSDVLDRGIHPAYITFDSWYAGKNMMKCVHWLYLLFYTRLKGNRKVIFQGETLTIKDLDRRFPITSFDHKHEAYIKGILVEIPGFGPGKLLFVREDRHYEPGKTKYLFTNNTNASAPEILLSYRSRWSVETCIRDIKQHLNLASCQARGLTCQQNHLALTFFAFFFLEFQPDLYFQGSFARTIGQKKQLLASLSLLSDQENNFFIFDSRKAYSSLTPVYDYTLCQVKDSFEFAFQTFYS